MGHAGKILRYEFQNMLRSKWLIGIAVMLLAVTEALFRFGGDPAKTIASVMNVVLVVVPLLSVVLGTIYFYNSREFNELLLSQPVNRTSIYLGKLVGFAAALCLAYAVGIGLPFLIHSFGLREYAGKIATLLLVGCCFIVIFSSLAFYAATRFEDRIKGLGATLLAWFFLAVIWDGVILLFVHLFREYPYEPGLLAMVFANPIDLGRILILMQLDISALMGYTGAVFRSVFGAGQGTLLAAAAMVIYAAVPVVFGLRMFRAKDF
ncbi:MAG TPA: ABC transporter permease subunit [Candidatus Krumholzibacteria bacterium]|nr:ABC transporter permease subunit [Candidatus Krumholzibacteria bacterium]